jgi:iron complex outermembrane recepter protein
MVKFLRSATFNGAFLFFGFQILAQKNLQDTIRYENLGEVVVSANRLSLPLKVNPGAVSLVSTAALSSVPRSIAADEALRLVPGVRIDNQANGSRIHLSIRGQGILSERGLRGIKVIIDGIPVNDPTGFAPDLYDIDWAVTDRVEVLRGPSASLYGGSANAGVLNITTAEGGEDKINGMLYSSIGSNGFYKVTAQAGGTVKNLKYRISYSNFGGDGYRHHTAFRGQVFNEKMNWRPSENVSVTQLLIVSGYFNQNAEGLNLSQLDDPRQANPDAIPCNEYQDTKRVTNGLVTNIKVSDNQQIELTGFLKISDYKEPGSSAVQYRDFFTPGLSAKYSIKTETGRISNLFSAGADFQFQTIDEYKLPNIKDPSRTEEIGEISMDVQEGSILLANQTVKQSSFGVFLIDKLELGKKLNTMFSLRYDVVSNSLTDKMNRDQLLSGRADFLNFTSRIGIAYNLNAAVNIYSNISQGYLPPATEELMNNPESYGGFNQVLEPSTSLEEEIGIRGYAMKSVFYDITLFHMDTRNDFYRYRITSRPLETFYGNMGSSNRNGIEISAGWAPVRNLSFKAAYTWSDFKYTSPDSVSGVCLPNSPVHQLYGDISYQFAGHFEVGLSTELQTKWYIYTDKVHSNIFQEGFNLYHVRIMYNFRLERFKGSVSLYGKNLTDKQYIAFTEPDPDGNCYQPSALREIFVSVKFHF